MREVLVLRSIEGRKASNLVRLLQKLPGEIEANLADAEEALAEKLGLARTKDVQAVLTEFVAKMDIDWILEVGCAAVSYLAGEAERTESLPEYRLN